MPQLNPAPWLLILLLSWMTLLLVFKMKTMSSTPMNGPSTPNILTQDTTPWNWPWT